MLPIHEVVKKCLEIVRTPISVVNVVGMLPDIASENRQCAVHQRAFAVRRFADDQFAVLQCQPSPTGSELGHAGLREIFLHLGDAAEIAVDLAFKLAWDLSAATVCFHPFQEWRVVVVLAGIVEETGFLAERSLPDFFERLPSNPLPSKSLLPLST